MEQPYEHNGQIIELFMRFCIDANIDVKQSGTSLGKYILAYQRNIEHKVAFDVLYSVGREAKAFMNWDYLERKLKKIENPIHWLHLFKFIDFTTIPKTQRMIREYDTNLRRLGVPSELIDANISCQLCILKNTNFIQAKVAVNRLFLENGIQNAHEKAMEFFSLIADTAFDMAETTTVFCHIISTCTFRTQELDSQIQFLVLRNEELSENFELKQKIRASSIRPRLRSKLSNGLPSLSGR